LIDYLLEEKIESDGKVTLPIGPGTNQNSLELQILKFQYRESQLKLEE